MKVRTNAVYTYHPTSWDSFDARTSLEPGATVRVVKLPGCPPPNTMGHAHVADPVTGRFIGLVCTASLSRE